MITEEKIRARVLVKAYPQPSEQYGETVCVAAITEDGSRLLRLYPVRFRNLDPEQRFKRFDLIEANAWQDSRDGRPESYKVIEDSLKLLPDSRRLSTAEKVRLWYPHVSPTIADLRCRNVEQKISLGIVRPEPESVRFSWERIEDVGNQEREEVATLYKQQSLIESELKPLPTPEYAFRYRFRSGEDKPFMKIHDWEVQATFHNYRRVYGSTDIALDKMLEQYQEKMPQQNLHFIMGTMKRRPRQFIIIGVLRTTEDVKAATAQQSLDL